MNIKTIKLNGTQAALEE